jgi:hypothetical protein
VLIGAPNPNMQGTVSLQTGQGNVIGGPSEEPTLVPTPELVQATLVPTEIPPTVPSAPQPPAGVCSATPKQPGAVNIRSGPATIYPVISSLQPNTYLLIQGLNNDGSWFVSLQGGVQSWVSGTVITLNGPCANLPFVQPPPPPTFTHTPVPPTFTFTPPAPETPTYTPTVVTPTPTPTLKILIVTLVTLPPPAVIAKFDVEPHKVNVNQAKVSFSNDISFPGGDTGDNIAYLVNAPFIGKKKLSIGASCTGLETQNAVFSVAGKKFGCSEHVTFDVTSGTAGGVTATAVAGKATYVKYTLNFLLS